MSYPDISKLRIQDHAHLNGVHKPNGLPKVHIRTPTLNGVNGHDPPPNDGNGNEEDPYMRKLKLYAQSLPYDIEPYSTALDIFDTMLLRLTECVEAKDYDVGLLQWESMIG